MIDLLLSSRDYDELLFSKLSYNLHWVYSGSRKKACGVCEFDVSFSSGYFDIIGCPTKFADILVPVLYWRWSKFTLPQSQRLKVLFFNWRSGIFNTWWKSVFVGAFWVSFNHFVLLRIVQDALHKTSLIALCLCLLHECFSSHLLVGQFWITLWLQQNAIGVHATIWGWPLEWKIYLGTIESTSPHLWTRTGNCVINL